MSNVQLNALNSLNAKNLSVNKTVKQISSGEVSFTDDAASRGIGVVLRANVAALKQVSVNAGQAVSYLQIANGAAEQVSGILTRLKVLAAQAASGQLTTSDRSLINAEYTKLRDEIDRIADNTEFNGQTVVANETSIVATGDFLAANGVQITGFNLASGVSTATLAWDYTQANGTGQFSLVYNGTTYTGSVDTSLITSGSASASAALANSAVVELTNTSDPDTKFVIRIEQGGAFATAGTFGIDVAATTLNFTGTYSNSKTFTVGIGADSDNRITAAVKGISLVALGLDGTNVSTQAKAEVASGALDFAIKQLARIQTDNAANINLFEKVGSGLATTIENLSAAADQYLNIDTAAKLSELARQQIESQVATAILGQANQLGQGILRLLQ